SFPSFFVILSFFHATPTPEISTLSLHDALPISMALLPEEFPVVLTVFLALGAWRMSQHHVLTRRAAVIETLGSASAICVDKTGTDRKSTRLNSSHLVISYAVFCLKKKKKKTTKR